jgi:hypothetical protein
MKKAPKASSGILGRSGESGLLIGRLRLKVQIQYLARLGFGDCARLIRELVAL